KVRDYEQGTILDLVSGKICPTNLPRSKVLYWELANSAWCCIRPSGTEPKIKFYVGVKGDSLTDAEKLSKKLKEGLTKLF
ncbi:MAG: phospho-sugar mutase, partial [Clostridia bacterium]|nr:phospho-sugar mutase [Clostridia bacterium]